MLPLLIRELPSNPIQDTFRSSCRVEVKVSLYYLDSENVAPEKFEKHIQINTELMHEPQDCGV